MMDDGDVDSLCSESELWGSTSFSLQLPWLPGGRVILRLRLHGHPSEANHVSWCATCHYDLVTILPHPIQESGCMVLQHHNGCYREDEWHKFMLTSSSCYK